MKDFELFFFIASDINISRLCMIFSQKAVKYCTLKKPVLMIQNPDPAFHFDTDLDPVFQFDTDPYPTV
jgi:hypothetical protein